MIFRHHSRSVASCDAPVMSSLVHSFKSWNQVVAGLPLLRKPDGCIKCCNYRRKVLSSELTDTIEQFLVYVHRSEAYFTYRYVYHTNVFEADNIYKKTSQMSFHLYFFAIFISLWCSTHDSADCWSAHISSAARDSFKCVHDSCKSGWSRPGCAPTNNNNYGYAGGESRET